MDVSCIALAGGKSSRLGRNKLVEYVGDRMLFHRVLDVLSRLGREIIVVTSRPSYLPDLSGYPNVKIVGDVYPGQGLPGGIYSGLAASGSDYNFVVASDMPFLNDVLMRYMLEIAHGSDLVAYREGDRFEPLHAVYSRRCMGAIVKLLECRNSRILELVDFVETRYLTPEELNRSDPNHLSFFNINTEEELRKAQAIAKGDSRILFS